MRSLVFATVFAGFSTTDDVLRVACDTGAVDDSNQLVGVTSADCVSDCNAACSHSFGTSTDMDNCLSQDSLLGCLFTIQKVREVDLKHCSADHSVVTLISQATLAGMGDGSLVQDVILNLSLHKLNVTACGTSAMVGVSSATYDDTACTKTGTGYSKTITISSDELSVNITDLLTHHYDDPQDTPIFLDLSCDVTIDDASVKFTLAHLYGYRPDKACSDAEGCEACVANGCTYCDWSRVSNLIPDWMPDWLTDVKNGSGVCGINTAVCKLSGGVVETTCGAAEMFGALTLCFVSFVSVVFN
eukprot:Blabericola_migrator_1__3155@NODE_1921_length_3558_cov_271_861644_g1228_i0_p2_GENE_NODE_1921_length_3558_cov_271_861644_g1228_i0NODE_1921_length_3558_cov_271_861644_g1228_i0_p2_ORF_typecomplete_len301_score40_53DUF685/PF05085_12/0_066_NODE_1921_length_3558_cov_271_861644_g1228_i016482550